MFIFTMWRSVCSEIEHPVLYNVKVRFLWNGTCFLFNVKAHFLWKWTSFSLQCAGPFSLKMNMFIFTMWRSVFSEIEHAFLYNMNVRFLWKWTCLSLQSEGPFSMHLNIILYASLYVNVHFSWNWNELYNVKVRFLLIWAN